MRTLFLAASLAVSAIATQPAACIAIGADCVDASAERVGITLREDAHDLTALVELTQVTEMRISSLGFPEAEIDLAQVASLEGLERLTLDRVAVSDLAALARLPELTRLSLENLPETDLSPLGELTQLETLSLRGNAWLTEAPLNNLHNLRSL
ncbi:MAG: hypothetical protein AAGH73_07675, partial [Pseudomonadota bacterium]